MTNDDREAVGHILGLAEQGRFNEIMAQMLVSLWISCEAKPWDIAYDISQITNRIVELYDVQGQIWEGLLPGGPGFGKTIPEMRDDRWHVAYYHHELKMGNFVYESQNVLDLAPAVDLEIEVQIKNNKSLNDDGWFAWIQKDNSNWIMTYEEAKLILLMNKTRTTYQDWNGDGDPFDDSIFQEISDSMWNAGVTFAQMKASYIS